MDNINIEVEEKVIQIEVNGGRGPAGPSPVTKSAVVTVNCPALEVAVDTDVSVTVPGVLPANRNIIAIGNSHNIPSEIVVKRMFVTMANTVVIRFANDGSGEDLSPAFACTVQVMTIL
jgi:hypothetical protein